MCLSSREFQQRYLRTSKTYRFYRHKLIIMVFWSINLDIGKVEFLNSYTDYELKNKRTEQRINSYNFSFVPPNIIDLYTIHAINCYYINLFPICCRQGDFLSYIDRIRHNFMGTCCNFIQRLQTKKKSRIYCSLNIYFDSDNIIHIWRQPKCQFLVYIWTNARAYRSNPLASIFNNDNFCFPYCKWLDMGFII